MFDYLFYLIFFEIIIYFVCDLLYYQSTFKYNLFFFYIYINFLNKMNDQILQVKQSKRYLL
jgi:hypothetical protein